MKKCDRVRLTRRSRGIRFSEVEWQRLVEAAAIRGVNTSEFVRISSAAQADLVIQEQRAASGVAVSSSQEGV